MKFSVDNARARRIALLAAPIVIAMFTQTFINVVDTILVGKLAPEYSIPGQSALGFSLPILWALGGFLASIGIGTQAMTARRFGARNEEGAGVVLANSAVTAVVTSVAITILGWFLVPVAFSFLTNNEDVVALGVPYARLRVLGILALVTTTGFKGFFDGIGSTRVHMYAAVVMNVANLLFSFPLIFGFGPIPAMYVTGAGLASLLATYVGLAMMVIWSLRSKYNSRFRAWRLTNLDPRVMWEILKLSLPSGAAQVFVMSGVLLFLKIVGMLDDAAALQVADRPPIFTTAAKLIVDLMSIGFVTCIAFGTATATLVSQSLGRGEPAEAEAYGWDSIRLAMYGFGAVSILILAFPAFFLDLLSDDGAVIHAAAPGLRIVALVGAPSAAALVLIQALFGAGDTKFVMWTEFVLHGLLLAPLAYLLAIVLDLGFLGVWWAAAAYVVVLALVMVTRFWRGKWKAIHV